jgi:hypothetical protein
VAEAVTNAAESAEVVTTVRAVLILAVEQAVAVQAAVEIVPVAEIARVAQERDNNKKVEYIYQFDIKA